ncbi:hypothetical protein OIO90_000703 [Microbotryomycetes sp. JL221]|nr:hypothetical protein OIO90_000703 [Microbotryomycetes sp. JL221]
MSSPKITVHWLNNSRSQRIIWLLEELELPYEIKVYQRDKKTMLAPPELYKVHPLGKSPVVTIEEPGSEPFVLAESGAIVETIIDRYGKGKLQFSAEGKDWQNRAQVMHWIHWAEGTAMLPLMLTIISARIPKEGPWIAKPLTGAVANGLMQQFALPRLKENFGFVNDQLAGKEFFVGDKLTGADIMMVFPIEGVDGAGKLDEFPHIKTWFEKIRQRPAYQRAEEKGGKNDMSGFTK